jgi:hypothetical protein
LGKTVQARSEDDVLSDPPARFFGDQILQETSAGQDGRTERPRERAHIRTVEPSLGRSRQLQSDFVFEYVRRRIDPHVHGPPQGNPNRRAVRPCGCGTIHISSVHYLPAYQLA